MAASVGREWAARGTLPAGIDDGYATE
jgi:hypothetical protein